MALALQRIRRRTADLLRREGRIIAREADLTEREAVAQEQERRNAATAQDLARQRRHHEAEVKAAALISAREAEVGRRAAALSIRETAARQQAEESAKKIADADRREIEHRNWIAVITASANGSLIGSFREKEGYFRMGQGAKAPPEAIAKTIASRPPAWAADMLRVIDATFRDKANAAIRLMTLRDEADDLESAIAGARSLLPSEQQSSLDGAEKAQKEVVDRLRRRAAMQDKGTSR